jgi:hypothetical protein
MMSGRSGGRSAPQRRLVKLALGIALLALIVAAVQIAHHLGDRQKVARVDLLFVFLRPARPHRAFHPRLALQRVQRLGHHIGRGQLPHADLGRLVGGHPERHLVLLERDDEEFQPQASDLLLFDRDDAADAVRRIDDELVRAEIGLLGLDHAGASSSFGWHPTTRPPTATPCRGDEPVLSLKIPSWPGADQDGHVTPFLFVTRI